MSELGTRELIECTYIVAVPVLRSLSEKKAEKKRGRPSESVTQGTEKAAEQLSVQKTEERMYNRGRR